MFVQSTFTYSSHGTPKPIYLPPRDLPKYSPLQNSMQQLPLDSKFNQGKERQRKQVQRAFSVPNRPSRQHRQPVKRQASNEELPTQCPDQAPSLEITLPRNSMKPNTGPARVFWEIKGNGTHGNESHQITGQEQEDTSTLDRHAQELAELRLGVEQVTERELEMAKRLEDFIVLSQDQNTQLQAEVQDLRNLLAIREEQLASATFRLGVIEEEREEDERKLNVAVAAVERMNVLEEQFAGLLKDVHQLYAVNADGIRKTYINT